MASATPDSSADGCGEAHGASDGDRDHDRDHDRDREPPASTTSRPRSRRFAIAVVGILLGTSALLRSAVIDAGSTGNAVSGVLALAAAVVLLVTVWPSSSAAGDDQRSAASDDATDSSVWNAIPSWQYEGRHVESGGLARGEQEQALQEIQEQADELEESPRE